MSIAGRRILVTNVFFAPQSYGGATIVAEETAKILAARGAHVTAISGHCRPDLHDYALTRAQVNGIDSFLINLPARRSYQEVYRNPRVSTVFRRLLDAVEPDIVHAHCLQDLGINLLDDAASAGIPSILSVHDFWWVCERQFMIRMDNSFCGQNPIRPEICDACVKDAGASQIRRSALHRAAEQTAAITYPSDYARSLHQRSGFGDGTGIVWPNGITPPGDEFLAQQARRRRDDPRLTFGFVGGPAHVKGWPLIQRVFSKLPRDDFNGVVVDGSLRGTWWTQSMLRPLRGNWRIAPRFAQAEADEFYSKIDVLLFPSQWKETYGLVIREALARGIRVLQTDGGGSTEHDGPDRALSFPIGDSDAAFSAAVLQVLDDHPRQMPSTPFISFADQATQLEKIMLQILS